MNEQLNTSIKDKSISTAVLFSGGKDSCLALSYALRFSDVKCLIIMVSLNSESYMFHTPNIKWAKLQAEAIGIPARVQAITNDLGLECFNPLWQKDQLELLEELVNEKFEVMIGGIAADGFDKSWLGRRLDNQMISELIVLAKKYGINPAFEGGEAESFVLHAQFFKKRLVIKKARKIMTGENSGFYEIEEMDLIL